jgi:hypothetical protein
MFGGRGLKPYELILSLKFDTLHESEDSEPADTRWEACASRDERAFITGKLMPKSAKLKKNMLGRVCNAFVKL